MRTDSTPYKQVDFSDMTEHLQTDYLDMYKGAQVEICQISQFDEISVHVKELP